MSRAVRLIAAAKINWTLEVLRIRPDGYHEVRSVMQTIGLHDVVTLENDSDAIKLAIAGEADMLAGNVVEENHAYRAAEVLRRRLGITRGVRITLEKHIPVAAGLGGGSTDAAAVLRGLDVLWQCGQPQSNLVEMAGEVGSDPPFFVIGGTAVVSGRGERVEALSDAVAPSIMLATPPAAERASKTAAMYEALSPDMFSDGYVTIGVRETVEGARMLVDENLNNVFEQVTTEQQPETEKAMDALRAQGYMPHLAGAGPSFFLLYAGGADAADELGRRISQLGFEPRPTHAISREHSLSIEEM